MILRNMAKMQVRRYWKRYLTKARYHCQVYFIYVPKPIAEQFLNMELSIRKVGPIIVVAPKGLEIAKEPGFTMASR